MDATNTILKEPMQVEMRVDTAQANPMVDMYEDDKFEFLSKKMFKP